MTFTTKRELRSQIANWKANYEALQEENRIQAQEAIREIGDWGDALQRVRLDTLQLVIDALEIKGYSPATGLYNSLIGSTSIFGQELIAERDSLKRQHLLKFEQDLRTALAVRAEIKRKAAEEATEAKVAGLLKKPALAGYESALAHMADIATIGAALGIQPTMSNTFVDTVSDFSSAVSSHPVVADSISDEALERILSAVRDECVKAPAGKKSKAKEA